MKTISSIAIVCFQSNESRKNIAATSEGKWTHRVEHCSNWFEWNKYIVIKWTKCSKASQFLAGFLSRHRGRHSSSNNFTTSAFLVDERIQIKSDE